MRLKVFIVDQCIGNMSRRKSVPRKRVQRRTKKCGSKFPSNSNIKKACLIARFGLKKLSAKQLAIAKKNKDIVRAISKKKGIALNRFIKQKKQTGGFLPLIRMLLPLAGSILKL